MSDRTARIRERVSTRAYGCSGVDVAGDIYYLLGDITRLKDARAEGASEETLELGDT